MGSADKEEAKADLQGVLLRELHPPIAGGLGLNKLHVELARGVTSKIQRGPGAHDGPVTAGELPAPTSVFL